MLFILLLSLPISIIDIKEHRIPDIITLPGILLAFLWRLYFWEESITESLFLLLTGFLPFYSIHFFSRGKLGLGDVKLSTLLALILGFEKWFLMVFFSSFAAVVFALAGLKLGKLERNSRIPFGPFLCGGAILAHYSMGLVSI